MEHQLINVAAGHGIDRISASCGEVTVGCTDVAGVVEAVGEGVTHLKVGDRAAYASQPPGSYCELRVMPATCEVIRAGFFFRGAYTAL